MVAFRTAQGRDGHFCAEIVRAWSLDTPWFAHDIDLKAAVDWWTGCLKAVETSWVCEHAGRIVGFCVREDDNITGLYVSSAARNRGVGKRLLDMAKADRDWITVWCFERNTRARKFYRREGCVEIAREVDDRTGLIDVEHRWTKTTATAGKDTGEGTRLGSLET